MRFSAAVCLLANMEDIIPDFLPIARVFFGNSVIIFGCFVTAKPARAYRRPIFHKIPSKKKILDSST